MVEVEDVNGTIDLMIPDSIFDGIESARFRANATVASSVDGFLWNVIYSSEFVELSRLVRAARITESILARIVMLAAEPGEEGITNPFDVPIAAYLVLVAATSPKQLVTAIDLAVKGENLWWTNKIVQRLRSMNWASGTPSLSVTVSLNSISKASPRHMVTNSSSSGSVVETLKKAA